MVSHSDWVQTTREKLCYGGLTGAGYVLGVMVVVAIGIAVMGVAALRMELQVSTYSSWKNQSGASELSYTGCGHGRKLVCESEYE